MVKRNQNYKMPGTPHHHIVKPTKVTGKLTDEEQKLYQTGVRMLLCLVKYLRPDISNAVRELSKGIKNVTPDVMKELTEITQPCIHTCDGLFICQLYSLPDLLEEMECKEDTPLTLPFASFISLSQLIIVK
jgi:hypothetical protein